MGTSMRCQSWSAVTHVYLANDQHSWIGAVQQESCKQGRKPDSNGSASTNIGALSLILVNAASIAVWFMALLADSVGKSALNGL